MTKPTQDTQQSDELDLSDKLTYEIYHIVGAVANTCHADGLMTSEDNIETATLPDFDDEVKQIIQLIHSHYVTEIEAAKPGRMTYEGPGPLASEIVAYNAAIAVYEKNLKERGLL